MRPSNSNSGAVIAYRFKLYGPGVWLPGLNRFSIHSVAWHPSLNRTAASDVNSDATIRASIAGSASTRMIAGSASTRMIAGSLGSKPGGLMSSNLARRVMSEHAYIPDASAAVQSRGLASPSTGVTTLLVSVMKESLARIPRCQNDGDANQMETNAPHAVKIVSNQILHRRDSFIGYVMLRFLSRSLIRHQLEAEALHATSSLRVSVLGDSSTSF
ncbi:hypothetical protein PCANC_13571 [Puccinia coronata f. sp. avenae]|uniref:Uncharacterized protein n=1 Tax=Puccinia coronata f. sp. avenae TaxID=200324 RepID=A0A2N5UCN6_9BASI|nr:hypothetical protein PCANC_13571 [Puccinia coronata f. sp. avenae]